LLFGIDELKSRIHKSITGVIHVGAHRAEELEVYKNLGVAKTIWIEANPGLLGHIINKTIFSPGQSIHLAAAHETDFEIVRLNVANNGESSSILDLDYHKIVHPHIHYVEQVEIPTRRVDSIVSDGGYDPSFFNFMNIDVQGAELLVLKGSTGILDNIDFIYSEVNERHLYKDCALVHEIDEFLNPYVFVRNFTKMTQFGWGDALYVKH